CFLPQLHRPIILVKPNLGRLARIINGDDATFTLDLCLLEASGWNVSEGDSPAPEKNVNGAEFGGDTESLSRNGNKGKPGVCEAHFGGTC
ncbi:hypothetical protein OOU_Y34scaffold00337g5, partial [Pyricularia oryzae Y34]